MIDTEAERFFRGEPGEGDPHLTEHPAPAKEVPRRRVPVQPALFPVERDAFDPARGRLRRRE